MVICNRIISREEAYFYYKRNKKIIEARLKRFPEDNATTQAYIKWNEKIKKEFDF